MAFLCSCGGSNIMQEKPKLPESSPMPDTADNNPIVNQTEQKPAEQLSTAVSITKNDVDIDGDGVADSVHAYATDLFKLPFYVDISLSADNTAYHTSINTDCLDTGNKMRIADITGDGVPEIVFPDLGGTSTRGEISAVTLQISDNGVKQIEVFKDGFFTKTAGTFLQVRWQPTLRL